MVSTHVTPFVLTSSTISRMVSQSGSLRSGLVALSEGVGREGGEVHDGIDIIWCVPCQLASLRIEVKIHLKVLLIFQQVTYQVES